MSPQTMIPGIRVEATGEDAERMLACVQACAGIPTFALQAGWLGALLDSLEEGHNSSGESFDVEWEIKALEMLGRLGGPPTCATTECKP